MSIALNLTDGTAPAGAEGFFVARLRSSKNKSRQSGYKHLAPTEPRKVEHQEAPSCLSGIQVLVKQFVLRPINRCPM